MVLLWGIWEPCRAFWNSAGSHPKVPESARSRRLRNSIHDTFPEATAVWTTGDGGSGDALYSQGLEGRKMAQSAKVLVSQMISVHSPEPTDKAGFFGMHLQPWHSHREMRL